MVNINDRSYEDCLKRSPQFNNKGGIDRLCAKLGIDTLAPVSLMHSVNKTVILPHQFADVLRMKQMYKLALKHVAKGVAYFREKKHTEAMQCFNYALSVDKNHVEGLVARGALYATLSSFKKAMEDLEKALEVEPNHKDASNYLAQVLIVYGRQRMENDNKAAAEAYFLRALKLNPQMEEAKDAIDDLRRKQYEKSRPKLELKAIASRKQSPPPNSEILRAHGTLLKIMKNEKSAEKPPLAERPSIDSMWEEEEEKAALRPERSRDWNHPLCSHKGRGIDEDLPISTSQSFISKTNVDQNCAPQRSLVPERDRHSSRGSDLSLNLPSSRFEEGRFRTSSSTGRSGTSREVLMSPIFSNSRPDSPSDSGGWLGAGAALLTAKSSAFHYEEKNSRQQSRMSESSNESEGNAHRRHVKMSEPSRSTRTVASRDEISPRSQDRMDNTSYSNRTVTSRDKAFSRSPDRTNKSSLSTRTTTSHEETPPRSLDRVDKTSLPMMQTATNREEISPKSLDLMNKTALSTILTAINRKETPPRSLDQIDKTSDSIPTTASREEISSKPSVQQSESSHLVPPAFNDDNIPGPSSQMREPYQSAPAVYHPDGNAPVPSFPMSDPYQSVPTTYGLYSNAPIPPVWTNEPYQTVPTAFNVSFPPPTAPVFLNQPPPPLPPTSLMPPPVNPYPYSVPPPTDFNLASAPRPQRSHPFLRKTKALESRSESFASEQDPRRSKSRSSSPDRTLRPVATSDSKQLVVEIKASGEGEERRVTTRRRSSERAPRIYRSNRSRSSSHSSKHRERSRDKETRSHRHNRPSESERRRRSPSPFRTRRRTPSPFRSRRRTPSPFGSRRRTPSPFGSRRRTPSPFGSRRRTPSPFGSRRRNSRSPGRRIRSQRRHDYHDSRYQSYEHESQDLRYSRDRSDDRDSTTWRDKYDFRGTQYSRDRHDYRDSRPHDRYDSRDSRVSYSRHESQNSRSQDSRDEEDDSYSSLRNQVVARLQTEDKDEHAQMVNDFLSRISARAREKASSHSSPNSDEKKEDSHKERPSDRKRKLFLPTERDIRMLNASIASKEVELSPGKRAQVEEKIRAIEARQARDSSASKSDGYSVSRSGRKDGEDRKDIRGSPQRKFTPFSIGKVKAKETKTAITSSSASKSTGDKTTKVTTEAAMEMKEQETSTSRGEAKQPTKSLEQLEKFMRELKAKAGRQE